MKKFLFSLVALLALSISVVAQERQVEVNVDIPAKKTLASQDIKLGGRLYLPMTDRLQVVGDITFQNAVPVFLNPTDQITAQGQMWVFLTSTNPNAKSQTRPFVFGGLAQNMFTGGAADSTTAKSGFGVQHFRASGFELTPTFEFETNSLTGGTIAGKAFVAKTYFKIPAGKEFRVNVTPYASRTDRFTPGFYRTEYGMTIGFGRVF